MPRLLFCLLLGTQQGSIHAYILNNIISLLKQDYTGEQKLVSQKKKSSYGLHQIRQYRKTNMKIQANYQFKSTDIIEIYSMFLFEAEVLNNTIINMQGVYKDVIWALSDKADLSIFKITGEVLVQWNLSAPMPKKWQLTYQTLSKVLNRLQKLDAILKFYHTNLANFKKIKNKFLNTLSKYNSDEQEQILNIQNSSLSKVLFLANRYLSFDDIKQLKQFVKLSTVKILYQSKKNILYKKNFNSNQQSEGQSIKIIDKKSSTKSIKNEKVANQETISNKKVRFDERKLNHTKNKLQSLQNLKNQFFMTSNKNAEKSNFFENKFNSKKKQQNKLHVHQKFIDKKIQKTLSHALYLQLNTYKKDNLQKINQQNKVSQVITNQQKKSQQLQNSIQKPVQNGTQQVQQKKAYQKSSIIPKVLLNPILIQQQSQKKQIQKNIGFIERIQRTMQKLANQFANNGITTHLKLQSDDYLQINVNPIGSLRKISLVKNLSDNIPSNKDIMPIDNNNLLIQQDNLKRLSRSSLKEKQTSLLQTPEILTKAQRSMSNTSLGFRNKSYNQTQNPIKNNGSDINQARPASRSYERARTSHYSSNSILKNKNLALNNFKTGLKEFENFYAKFNFSKNGVTKSGINNHERLKISIRK